MKKLFGWLLLTLASSACATGPIFTLVPQGTLPTSIAPGKTATALYTVTNKTSYTLTNLGLSYAPHGKTPVGVTQNTITVHTPSTCAMPFNLKPGQSCTLDLTITADALVSGIAKGGPEVCSTGTNPAHCSIPTAKNQLNVFKNAVPALAVGNVYTGEFIPFFIESYDLGTSWVIGNAPLGLPQGVFTTADCNAGMCVIGTGTSLDEENLNIVIASVDGGATWNTPNLPTLQEVINVACTQGQLGMCFVWGYGYTDSVSSFQYTASKRTWTEVQLFSEGDGFHTLFVPSNASCGANLCVVSGGTFNFNTLTYSPAIKQIMDPGASSSTWQAVTSVVNGPIPSSSYFSAASCDGHLCVIAGQTTDDSQPFVLRTTDGGKTWTFIDLSYLVNSNPTFSFQHMSCNETSQNCAAVTQQTSNNFLNDLYTSADGGLTWAAPGIEITLGAPAEVSCSSALCVLAGFSANSFTHFSYQSVGGGAWTSFTVSGVQPEDAFYSVSCEENFCFIGGQYNSSGAALLVQTVDAGTAWHVFDLTTIPDFPAAGYFEGSFAGPPAAASASVATEMDFFTSKGLHR